MPDFREETETPFTIDAKESYSKENQRMHAEDDDFPNTDNPTQSEMDTKAMEYLSNLHSHADSYRKAYYDSLWETCERAYLGYKEYRAGAYNHDREKTKEKFRSNIRVWNVFVQVESGVAQMVPSFLSDPDSIVYVSPTGSETPEAISRANGVKELLKYQFTQQMDATQLLTSWLKMGRMKGLSAMKLSYKYEVSHRVKRRPIFDPATGKCVGFVRMKRKTVLHDRPDITVPNIEYVWWNPDADEFDDNCRWVIEKMYYTKDEIEMLGEEGIFRNTKEFLDKAGEAIADSTTKFLRTGILDFASSYDPMFEIYEFRSADRILTGSLETMDCFRDGDTFIDSEHHGYFWNRATTIPGEHVGIGDVEPILDLDDESNTKRNQRIDNINRSLNQQFLAGASSGIRTKQLEWIPFNVIRGNDITQFKTLEFPDVTQNAMVEDERAKMDMDKTNANFDIGRGEAPQKTSSATEIATRQQNMTARRELQVQLLHRSIAKMWKCMWELDLQFGCQSAIVRIVGPDGQKLRVNPVELYAGEYDFEFGSGGYIGNKMYDLAQLQNFLQQILPTPMGAVLDMRELWKLVSKRFNVPGIENVVSPEAMGQTIDKDPVDENVQMLLTGEPVPVMMGEDHARHIAYHVRDLMGPSSPPEVQQLGSKHINQHTQYQQQLAASQPQQGGAPAPQAAGAPGGQPGNPMAGIDPSNRLTPGGANAPNIMA